MKKKYINPRSIAPELHRLAKARLPESLPISASESVAKLGVAPAPMMEPTPIVRPEVDDSYLKKHYDLVKRFSPGPLDTAFDHIGYFNTNDATNDAGTFVPIAGQQAVIYTYNVPVGQRFILTQYCFFALIDERPAFNYFVLAEPLEFAGGIFDFLILSNGKIPMSATYSFGAIAFPPLVREGFTCLTKNIDIASDPNHGGIVIPFRGGTKMEIIIRNHVYSYLPIVRRVVVVGFRFRGFLSPVNPEER